MMKTPKRDIFRSSGRVTHHDSSPPATPPAPAHRAIFRRPKQTYSHSPSTNSGSSDESMIATPLQQGPSWPPLTIPESESAETSKLGLSRPIQTGSSASSRHNNNNNNNMDISTSSSSEREQRKTPSYYKIHMKNGLASLAFGEDSSEVGFTDNHNDRILLTPIQERKRLIRATPITEASSSSSSHSPKKSPGRGESGKGCSWEVLEDGRIVFNPATPGSSKGGSPRRIQARTPQAPRKPYLKRTIHTPKTPTTLPMVNGSRSPSVDSPPRLAKSSFDTISTDASSTDNSFYNEMFDLAQPTSPPRMDRMKCPQQALFEEGSKCSGEFSRSRSRRSSKSSQRRSPIGNEKYVEFRPNQQPGGDNCSASFLTQLFDLFAIGPCCQNNPIMTCGRMTAV